MCSAALRLSSARGRERELFVPVAHRLAATHRGSPTPAAPEPTGAPSLLPLATPMPPAQGWGDGDIWERTTRPFACCQRRAACAGLLVPMARAIAS